MSIRVTISSDVTGRIARLLRTQPQRIAQNSARAIAADAKRRVPVDTGALRDSIRVEGTNVVVGEEYSAYVEYGTAVQPPQPYLTPAVEAEKAKFERSLLRLFDGASITASAVDTDEG